MKKTFSNPSFYRVLMPAISVILSLSANQAQAVTDLFWDNNGTATPSNGTWDNTTANWASSSNLTSSTQTFSSGAFAEFIGGTSSVPSLTISVPVTVTAAGITTAPTGAASVAAITFSGAGSIALSSGLQGLICPTGGSMAFNVPLSGAGGIEAEIGTVTLNVANSYTNSTEVGLGGTLRLGAANVIPNGTGNGTLAVLTGGKFDLGGYNCAINGFGTSSVGIIDCTTGTATLTIGYSGSTGTTTHSGIIQNTSPGILNITIDNCPTGATTAFNGTNTYSGITTINNGLLQITNDYNLGAVPGSLVANSITLNQGVSMTGVNYGLRLQSTTAVTLNANRGIYLGINGGNLECQSGKTLTVNGPISGPGALWAGGGTAGAGIGGVVLANTGNTYSGGTYINGGNLSLGGNNTLPTGTPLWMGTSSSGGGTYFYMKGYNQTIGPLTGINGANGPQIQLTGALTILETNVSTTFTGVIGSAGGSLTLSAAGGTPATLTLTNVNTYTGPTFINGSTLALSGIGSIGKTANISIAAGGTFDVSQATSPYASTNTWNASGTGTTLGSTAAAITGASGGQVNLGSQAISLTFTPTAFIGDSNHPALYVSQGTLNLNGNTISVNNAGASPLRAGIYVLIQTPNNVTGTVSSAVTVTGAGIMSGETAAISISGTNVILTVSGSTPTSPNITSYTISGTQLNISATGGTPNGTCYVVETTNLSILPQYWSRVYTTNFNGSGNVSISANVVNTNLPAQFFALQNP